LPEGASGRIRSYRAVRLRQLHLRITVSTAILPYEPTWISRKTAIRHPTGEETTLPARPSEERGRARPRHARVARSKPLIYGTRSISFMTAAFTAAKSKGFDNTNSGI
jgi:hypothetical protein